MLHTPVVFLIFNRPRTTELVFTEIARVKPLRLLVIADGPRSIEEETHCEAARSILRRIDWECEVTTNFSDVNLGCKRRVASGLDWVFGQCEEAIILEDDCLPHPSFFTYCTELLEKYRDDNRVPMICGTSFHNGPRPTSNSYYFSRLGHIWGWASWRRAWRNYDVKMKVWPDLRTTPWLLDILGDFTAAEYWRNAFDRTFAGQIDTWDYQWFFSWWVQNGLAIIPNINLISNIGFGKDATHTKTASRSMANLPVGEMAFPLRHPSYMVRDRKVDLFTFTQMCPWALRKPLLSTRFRRSIMSILPRPFKKLISQFRVKSAH